MKHLLKKLMVSNLTVKRLEYKVSSEDFEEHYIKNKTMSLNEKGKEAYWLAREEGVMALQGDLLEKMEKELDSMEEDLRVREGRVVASSRVK